MFAGGRRVSSNNVRAMQLFHELKQQFPTIPDHVVSACIATNEHTPASQIHACLQHELMGRHPAEADPPILHSSTPQASIDTNTPHTYHYNNNNDDVNGHLHETDTDQKSEPNLNEMNVDPVKSEAIQEPKKLKRPDHLPIKADFLAQAFLEAKNLTSVKTPSESSKTEVLGKTPLESSKTVEVSGKTSIESSKSKVESATKIRQLENYKAVHIPEEPNKLKRPDHLPIKADFLPQRFLEAKTEVAFESAKTVEISGKTPYEPAKTVEVSGKTSYEPSNTEVLGKIPVESATKIRQSEKCKDVHKLLNENLVSDKPPRSPVSANKRLLVGAKKSLKDSSLVDICDNKSEFCDKTDEAALRQEIAPPKVSTPEARISNKPATQQSAAMNIPSGDPSTRRSTSTLHVIPQHPWANPELGGTASGRSYTKVHLTLRPPSMEPQAPIDITSQNSSLTYSTSSFDSQRGLQSQLQITVGPTGGSVSSIRTRPRPSSYHPEEPPSNLGGLHTGSLPELSTFTTPVIVKQQARIERLRIELTTEKTRLISMKREVVSLENSKNDAASELAADRTDAELEKQLQREIRHLRGQCEMLTLQVDNQTETRNTTQQTDFYGNIYTGQQGHLGFDQLYENHLTFAEEQQQRGVRGDDSELLRNRPIQYEEDPPAGINWNCSVCTFQNHPLLQKCELCDMPRILHGNTHTINANQRRNINQSSATPPTLSSNESISSQSELLAHDNSTDLIKAANGLFRNLQQTNQHQEFVRRHSVPSPLNTNPPMPAINQVLLLTCPEDLQFETDFDESNAGFCLNKRDSMNNLLILSDDSGGSSPDTSLNMASSSNTSLSSNTPLMK